MLKASSEVGLRIESDAVSKQKNSKISGEVKSNCIYLYDTNNEVAFETLKHEFIDYAISQTIEPNKEVTNRLIFLINEIAYTKKERIVEAFARLIS